jgi:hypothetical protein
MIILNNEIYTIHTLSKPAIIAVICGIIVPLLFFLIVGIISKIKKENLMEDNIISGFAVIFAIILVGTFIFGGIAITINFINAPQDEIELYNAAEEQSKVLKAAIERGKGTIDTALYQQILYFNQQVIKCDNYATNPYYAPMRWNKDWNNLKVNIPKEVIIVQE